VAEVKHKEGRHVGLDFYDLLIEAIETDADTVVSGTLVKGN
jgi:hypothetical protein